MGWLSGGGGREEGSQGRRGQKGTEWGLGDSAPKHWLVESEVTSNRAVQLRAPDCSPDPPSSLSLSNSSTAKSAPCTKHVSAGAGRRALRRSCQQRGIAQAGLLPGLFGSGQGEVPCGSAELVPVSLARLLWLPERGLGRRGGPILGDSMLPPASPKGLAPVGSLTPVRRSLSSRLEVLRSESLSLSLETTLPRAHV